LTVSGVILRLPGTVLAIVVPEKRRSIQTVSYGVS
jgi:hypothetical protein